MNYSHEHTKKNLLSVSKTTKSILFLALLTIAGATLFSSCFKHKNNAQLDANIDQHNKDANEYKSELDQADNDINNALSDIPAFGKAENGAEILSSPLCGCTIDSTDIANKILYFNFDGLTPCFSPSVTRSGQIKVQLTSGVHWSDAGSVLTETFTNYKITRLSDNKSIMFNGVKTLENIAGHNWLTFLTSQSTFYHRERAFNVDVTFDNNQHATWNSARTTEWSYVQAGGGIPYARVAFEANGDTSVNGYNTVDSWGTNRFGSTFTTYYNAPVNSNTYCGLWRFSSGELVHHVDNNDFTLTLGVDQNGNPSTLSCAYGFKVEWSNGNSNYDIVLSY